MTALSENLVLTWQLPVSAIVHYVKDIFWHKRWEIPREAMSITLTKLTTSRNIMNQLKKIKATTIMHYIFESKINNFLFLYDKKQKCFARVTTLVNFYYFFPYFAQWGICSRYFRPISVIYCVFLAHLLCSPIPRYSSGGIQYVVSQVQPS